MGDFCDWEILEEVGLLLFEYGKILRDIGRYVLLFVIFDMLEDLVEYCFIEEYEELFWFFLKWLSGCDLKDWLEDMLEDFEYYKWEFCFDGELYFILCVMFVYEVR